MFQENPDGKHILLVSYLMKMVPFKNLKIFYYEGLSQAQ